MTGQGARNASALRGVRIFDIARQLTACEAWGFKDNPPLFFMEAENEGLFPGHYNKVLLEKHLQWGLPSQMKVYQYAEHGFFYDLSRPIQREAFEDIFNFVKKING